MKDLWNVYSWEPSTKVPGGRKRRIEAQVEAPSRIAAKEGFLKMHPEELPHSIAASRVKSEETAADNTGDLFDATGPGPSQKFAEESTAITDELKKNAFWPEIEAKIAVASNAAENFSVRYSAISYIRGSSRVSPTSEFSKFCFAKANELGVLLFAGTRDNLVA